MKIPVFKRNKKTSHRKPQKNSLQLCSFHYLTVFKATFRKALTNISSSLCVLSLFSFYIQLSFIILYDAQVFPQMVIAA